MVAWSVELLAASIAFTGMDSFINDCYLDESSLAKNLQMLFKVGGEGGGDPNPVANPVFHR